MAARQYEVITVSMRTNVDHAIQIVLDHLTKNEVPTNEEIVKADLHITKKLTVYQGLLDDVEYSNEETFLKFSINRYWEIKKLLLAVIQKKVNMVYTPSIPDLETVPPPYVKPTLTFPIDWPHSAYREQIFANIVEIKKTLESLWEILTPEDPNIHSDKFLTENIYDLDIKDIAAIESSNFFNF